MSEHLVIGLPGYRTCRSLKDIRISSSRVGLDIYYQSIRLRNKWLQAGITGINCCAMLDRTRVGHEGDMPCSVASQPVRNDQFGHEEHLIVLVNGLFGSRWNWDAMVSIMNTKFDLSKTTIMVSRANEFSETYHGIDVCGRRLADEILDEVKKNHRLKRISIIGHSMGGLIARYAIGELFDPNVRTVAGLIPSHFLSLATPHLGCTVNPGPAQVPLLDWFSFFSQSPLGYGTVKLFSSFVLGQTGRQFFLQDQEGPYGIPLIYRLAHDWPDENKYFLSSLGSFRTRTAYANRSWDHLVGWANSSIRSVDELPSISMNKACGVVREDPLTHSLSNGQCYNIVNEEFEAKNIESLRGRRHQHFEPNSIDLEINNEALTTMELSSFTDMKILTNNYSEGRESKTCIKIDNCKVNPVEATLLSLQRLPWRRIDVCFSGGTLPLLAHQNLQVQRKWLNFDGEETAHHIVEQILAMEKILFS